MKSAGYKEARVIAVARSNDLVIDPLTPAKARVKNISKRLDSSKDPFRNMRVLMDGQIFDNDAKLLERMSSIQAFEESKKDNTAVVVHAAGLIRALMHGERSHKKRGDVAGNWRIDSSRPIPSLPDHRNCLFVTGCWPV